MEALRAIVHDPAATGWQTAATALLDSGTGAAGRLEESENVLVEALGHLAVAKLAEAEERVSAAVGTFHDALPELVRSVMAGAAALKDKVSSVEAAFHAEIVSQGTQVEADVRNLGLSILRQQISHEARLMQRLGDFGRQLEVAVRAVEDLGGEVGRLRSGLDRSVQGSLQPIDDVRVILEDFHHKFGSIG